MKNKRWIAAFFVCLTITCFANLSTSVAQTKVAIVDIGLIFKSHPQFAQQLGALKQEADQFKATSLEQQKALMGRAEVLKQYEPSSVDFKTAETQLAQESAALEVDQRDKMRMLMQKEAQLHFNTYAQVNELISKYCEAGGIQLVLRYNSAQMDPKNPQSVMQRVNGSVVYHNQQNDITPELIARIAQMSGTANNAGNAARR
ncbi:MAG: OmpH family outer membrane protein [Mariniblastus sp.]